MSWMLTTVSVGGSLPEAGVGEDHPTRVLPRAAVMCRRTFRQSASRSAPVPARHGVVPARSWRRPDVSGRCCTRDTARDAAE